MEYWFVHYSIILSENHPVRCIWVYLKVIEEQIYIILFTHLEFEMIPKNNIKRSQMFNIASKLKNKCVFELIPKRL